MYDNAQIIKDIKRVNKFTRFNILEKVIWWENPFKCWMVQLRVKDGYTTVLVSSREELLTKIRERTEQCSM
jgi:hypothetical protein